MGTEIGFCTKQYFFVLILVFLSGFVSLAIAGGEGHHHHEESGHMQSMMAVKELIPEEYTVMDRTPVTPTSASIIMGKELYLENCSVCHGNDGKGNGPAAAAMSTPPANFLDKKHSATYGPGEKYWIIGNGSGKTGMPGFPQIDSINRWHLVNYILHLQQGGAAETKEHGHH